MNLPDAIPRRLAALAALALVVGACRSAAPASAPVAAPETLPTPRAAPPADGTPSEPAAEAGEETYSNTVRWTTASEVDNFGYDVYRGDTPEGPFERINPEVIEGAGTTDEPTRYRWVDDTIDPRRTYYYYVESISMSGVRERFTPIGKAPPKVPPEDAGDG